MYRMLATNLKNLKALGWPIKHAHICGQSARNTGRQCTLFLSNISPHCFILRAISQKNENKDRETLGIYGMLWYRIVVKKIICFYPYLFDHKNNDVTWVLTSQEMIKLSFDELHVKEQRNVYVFSTGYLRARGLLPILEEGSRDALRFL